MQILARSKFVGLTLLSALVFLYGCEEFAPNATQQPKKPQSVTKESRVPVHRFVLTKFAGGVAFDTQTGQICRTWDWSILGKPEKPDPVTGIVPQRSFGEQSPTCVSLYKDYPSGTTAQSELLSDE